MTGTDFTPRLILGDCVEAMAAIEPESVDAVVCDPPYELGFMGKSWDSSGVAFDPKTWEAALRVLKPGGHLLAFGGTRTVHRIAVAIEDAGFDIRDQIAWMFGSGFPKSLDVSKGIDKLDASVERLDRARTFQTWLREHMTPQRVNEITGTDMGHHLTTHPTQPSVATADLFDLLRPYLPAVPAEIERLVAERTVESQDFKAREIIGVAEMVDTSESRLGFAGETHGGTGATRVVPITSPYTSAAREWQGWGTALKPAHEPVVWAQKPFSPVPCWDEVNTIHHGLAALLWLALTPAKRAVNPSLSSLRGPHAAWCVSARVSVATVMSPDESERTGTYNSLALAATCSNIVKSWSSILADLSTQTRMSTTSTASSTTTALRTLNSLLAPLTSPTTMPVCECLTVGQPCYAQNVDAPSSVEWTKWLDILSASAPATAIEPIALAVASALAQVADVSSGVLAVASSAGQTATTAADASPEPAFEPIVVARKPLIGTVAANVLAHGTGALNIDACRIGTNGGTRDLPIGDGIRTNQVYGEYGACTTEELNSGRWPANVILDAEAGVILDAQTGESVSRIGAPRASAAPGDGWGMTSTGAEYDDMGGASRFFYCPKVSRAERSAGLEADAASVWTDGRKVAADNPRLRGATARANHHPTVKPIDLMRYLIRLVTPPGGTVLDPFMGSGSTGCAAVLEGARFIGIEREQDYMAVAEARVAFWAEHGEDALAVMYARDAAEREKESVVESGQMDLWDVLG